MRSSDPFRSCKSVSTLFDGSTEKIDDDKQILSKRPSASSAMQTAGVLNGYDELDGPENYTCTHVIISNKGNQYYAM